MTSISLDVARREVWKLCMSVPSTFAVQRKNCHNAELQENEPSTANSEQTSMRKGLLSALPTELKGEHQCPFSNVDKPLGSGESKFMDVNLNACVEMSGASVELRKPRFSRISPQSSELGENVSM